LRITEYKEVSEESTKEAHAQQEQVPSHMRTGMFRENFGENYKAWMWAQKNFSKVSIGAIVAILITAGSWLGSLYAKIGDQATSLTMLQHDVKLLQDVKSPPNAIEEANKVRETLQRRIDEEQEELNLHNSVIDKISAILDLDSMQKLQEKAQARAQARADAAAAKRKVR
jgi:hypothetical protein